MELFGYKIEKKIGSSVAEKGTKSFVAPNLDDGSTVIDGGGINAFSVNFDTAFTTQQELIAKYRAVARQPEAETAIDDIINEAIVLDPYKDPVTIYLDKLDTIDVPENIKDMVDAYMVLLTVSKEKIAGKIFNAGYENQTVKELAETVKSVVGEDVNLITTPTDDNRSYHISSQKIKDELGFETTHTIQDAVEDLCAAFEKGLLPNSLEDEMYFNIKRMQNVELT